MAYTILPPVNETLPQTADLYTTVKNIATNIPNTAAGLPGSVGTQYIQMFFGFLPPHGRLLSAGEEVTVFGTLANWITRFTTNDRARRSLETALSGIQTSQVGISGYSTAKWGRNIGQCLQIISTPAVFVKDTQTAQVGKFAATANTATFVTPCWDNTNFYDNPIYFKSGGTNFPQGLPTFGWQPGWAGGNAASAFSGQLWGSSIAYSIMAGNVSSGYGQGGAIWSGASIDAASLAKYFDPRWVPATGGASSGASLLQQQLTDVYNPITSSPYFRAPGNAISRWNITAPLPANADSISITLPTSSINPALAALAVSQNWATANECAILTLTGTATAGLIGTYHFNLVATVTLKAKYGGGTQAYNQACTLVIG
jgi:hypothetical protein